MNTSTHSILSGVDQYKIQRDFEQAMFTYKHQQEFNKAMSETKRLIVNAFGLTQEQWEEVEKWDIKQMPILPLKGHNSNATPIL